MINSRIRISRPPVIIVLIFSLQAKEIMFDYKPGVLENSAKMVLLFHLIEESVRKGDKLLVFR